MTHIIQSPKPRKQGATFADVPVGEYFLARDRAWKRSDEVEALGLGLGLAVPLPPDEPVTLLSVQPIDPEPDPGVCTFEELKPGEWFADGPQVDEQDRRGLHLRGHGDECTVASSGAHGRCHPRATFRRVSASVVEHEEPGTHVLPESDGMFSLAEAGYVRVSRSHLQRIVQQGAALLAQQAASPESGEPEPAELQAGDRIDVVFEGRSDDIHDLRVGIVKREPAEDRSKPAPGWTTRRFAVNDGPWRWDLRYNGDKGGYCDCPTRCDAIAESWAFHDEHDAQQAGEGES